MNAQISYEKDLLDLSAAIVDLGTEYAKNVQKLTETCGKIIKANCAFYQRLRGKELHVEGEWQMSINYERHKNGEGHLCADIIRSATVSDVQTHHVLPKTCHFHQPCYKAPDGCKTYIASPVFSFSRCVGLLCVVFPETTSLSPEQTHMLNILAKAIGMEEERKEYEDIIREREALYRLLFDSAPDAILALDSEGNIVDCNSALESLMHLSYTDIVGKNAAEFIPDAGKEQFNAMMKTVIEKSFLEWESNHRFSNEGPHISVWWKIKAMYTPEGAYRGSVLFIRDLSSRKKIEEARLREERFQGVLETAGAACHELNQPLQAIMGYVDLLLRHLTEEGNARKWAVLVKSQVDRFAGITRRLNTITRYEVQEYLEGTKIIDLKKASEEK